MDVTDVIGPKEEVKLVVHKHWVAVVPLMAAFLILSGLALVGIYALGRYATEGGSSRVTLGAEGIGLAALVALGLLLAYASYWVYRQNLLIVTSENLYLISQNSLVSRKVTQFELGRLQDVTANQGGIIATVFNYGDVTVETAGEEENPAFKTVGRPHKLANQIMELHEQLAGKDGGDGTQ